MNNQGLPRLVLQAQGAGSGGLFALVGAQSPRSDLPNLRRGWGRAEGTSLSRCTFVLLSCFCRLLIH